MNKVSVIIPTHNRPELLKNAVNSVLNQSYKDLELIVVDDGLEKRADGIIKDSNDLRLKYILHEKEKGGSAARNTGIRNATGDFIALLDDDDEWLPEKLEVQMKEFEKSPTDVGFCFSAVTNDYGKELKNTRVPSGIGNYLELALLRAKTFLNVTLIVKKYVFDEVGFFDESFPSHQEADLVIRMAKKYKGLGINLPLVRVNMRPGHDSIGSSIEKGIIGKEMILSKHWNDFKDRPEILSRRYFELGLIYRDSSQFKKAWELFKKAWRTNFRLKFFVHYLSLIFNGRLYRLFR